MKITDAFLGEHGVFYAQFDHLEQLLRAPGSLEQVQDAAALLGSALKPHAEMEDELLFGPAMAKLGHPHDALGTMHEEHEQVERLLEAVRDARDVRVAVEALRRALELARDHFLKEEQVTFALAEHLLGEEEMHALGAEWGARRAVELNALL